MKRYLSLAAALIVMLSIAIGSRTSPAMAANGDVGYRDFQFGSSCNSTPTGEKPESKLWWNDGIWWGSLCATDNTYHIFRLDLASQSWIDTGTRIDDRPTTKADTLWDKDHQHLYVASHVFTSSGTATSSSSSWGRLYRFSYNSVTRTYSLDSGFPVNVTRGKSETMVLEQAKNGQLWVTYVESNKVMVNHSGASDTDWGAPFALGVTGASNLDSDDISSIISFDRPTASPKVGILWSNQTDKKMYFATHVDGESENSWSSFGIYVPSTGSPSAADDHINIKLQSDGVGVYAVTKTSNSTSSQPLIVLHSCKSGCADVGNWHATTIYVRGDNHTRAILLLDTSNRKINIFSTTPESGGNIYRKVSDMDTISFPNGHGDLFLKSTADTKLNNPTSTKQNVNSTTGLVVLASDQNTRRYLHNYDPLGGSPPPPPGPTADFSATPRSGAAPLAVSFTDLSTNGPTSWAWDFDNNGTVDSTAQNPIFTYANPGTYTVRLTAGNSAGSDDEIKTDYITVSAGGGGGTGSATLLPNGDGARDAVIKDNALGTTNLYTAIDDTIAGADDGTTYIRNDNKTSGSYFALLTDMPTNFASMSTLNVSIRARTTGFVDDNTTLYAQLYKADGVTPLSNEVAVATNPGTAGWLTVANVALSGVVPGTKADWDGARLRLRWAYTAVGTSDTTQIRVTAVQLGVTYSTGP
jgi:PKD repeat protein